MHEDGNVSNVRKNGQGANAVLALWLASWRNEGAQPLRAAAHMLRVNATKKGTPLSCL